MKEYEPVATLPAQYLNWLVSSRINFINEMREGRPLRYFSAHLPVMATWPSHADDGNSYPMNMTVKGIGLIPRQELLDSYSEMFEDIAASSSAKHDITERIAAINKLYGDIGNFDTSVLGGLEIFGGKTLANLNENNKASLLYVGMSHTERGVSYISFQVNGLIEILNKDNPYYRFLLASRKLFEFDKFHIFQPDYPFGYLIRVVEVMDKSPWPKAATPHGHGH
ncbi:MAG: hypothetical protein HQK95_03345 [Nitrospirae bacterium]|nr:hypothetical protein [Nitrospirota bacterium]